MSSHDVIRTDNVLVRVMELDHGASTKWHYHTEVTDYFVCLNGAIKGVRKQKSRLASAFLLFTQQAKPVVAYF